MSHGRRHGYNHSTADIIEFILNIPVHTNVQYREEGLIRKLDPDITESILLRYTIGGLQSTENTVPYVKAQYYRQNRQDDHEPHEHHKKMTMHKCMHAKNYQE